MSNGASPHSGTAVPVPPQYRTTPDPTQKRMPGGIPYIIGNELAERFSFYGMNAILTIFLAQHLLNEQGQLDPMGDEEAKTVFHLFKFAAYFTPLLGAVVADVLLGKYRTILTLSLLYCVGHGFLAMMDLAPHFDVHMAPFLYAGLLFIALGAGAIKPCVSAHVGDQFGAGNKRLLPKIFAWFYFSINVGAATSTILTPIFLEEVGPWLAFGVPGVLMAIATLVFWLGRNKFIHVPASGWRKFKEETFSPDGRRALLNLAPIFLIFIPMFWALFDQTGSAWVLQAITMDREVLGVSVLPSQMQAVNPLFILTLIPVFTYAIYPAINRIFPLTALRRISIGLFVTVLAFSTSALIEARIQTLAPEARDSLWEVVLEAQPTGAESIRTALSLAEEVEIDAAEAAAFLPGFIPADVEPTYERLTEALNDRLEAAEARIAEVGVPVPTDAIGERLDILNVPEAAGLWARIEAEAPEGYQGLRLISRAVGPMLEAEQLEPAAVDAVLDPMPSILWQVLAYLILTAAEVMVSITSLEFAYTQAPKRMKSFIMGVYFFGVALGNLFVSAVNLVIQNEDGTSKLDGASYYWFFTAAMLLTAVAFVFFAQFYKGQMYIQGEEDTDNDRDVREARAGAEGTDAR